MRLARWYCPPGVDRPAHATVPVVCRMAERGGPPGAPPGGVCYGGPIEPDEQGWKQHAGGWWFNFDGAAPMQFIKLDLHPRLTEWRTVAGADPAHLWRVPVLVTPICDEEDPDRIIGFKSGLDRVWNGTGWDLPADLIELRQRLLWTFQEIAGETLTLSSSECVDMALRLLEQGQQFDRAEIVAAGWVSEVLVVRTLCAATDRELG